MLNDEVFDIFDFYRKSLGGVSYEHFKQRVCFEFKIGSSTVFKGKKCNGM